MLMMSCEVMDHPYSEGANGTTADYPGSGQDPGGPNLILSNAPEILGGQEGFPNTGYLYRATIGLATNLAFRVFLWHINETGSTKYFRITAKTTSGTAAASSRRYAEGIVADRNFALRHRGRRRRLSQDRRAQEAA